MVCTTDVCVECGLDLVVAKLSRVRAASAPEAGFAGEVQAARAGHRTCPRTLMLTMFGSAFESSLLTSSALLIVLLGRCAVAWLRAVAATAAAAYSAVLWLPRLRLDWPR